MKKSILILTVCAMLLAGCVKDQSDPAQSSTVTTAEPANTEPVLAMDGDTYVITEDKFLEGASEIFDNRDFYIGKRIQLEGEYMAELYENEMYYQVYRYVSVTERHEDEDGHVHTHASQTAEVGFRIKYDKNNKPSNRDFVRVAGIVESYEMNGENYLIINADTLEKIEGGGNTVLKY